MDFYSFPSNKTVEFGEVKLFLLTSQAIMGTLYLPSAAIFFVLVLLFRKSYPIRVHNTPFLLIKCVVVFVVGCFIIAINACPRYFNDYCYDIFTIVLQYMALVAPTFYLTPIVIKFWIIIITFQLNKQKLKIGGDQLNQEAQLKKFSKMKTVLIRIVPAIFFIVLFAMLLVFAVGELILYLTFISVSVIYGLLIAGLCSFFLMIVIAIMMVIIVVMKIKSPFAMITLNVSSVFVAFIFGCWMVIGAIFFMEALYAYIMYVFLYIVLYGCILIELFLSVGMPVLQAIIWKKQQKSVAQNSVESVNEITKLLQDKSGYKIFSDFAASEWSTENLNFYTDFSKLKQLEDNSQQLHLLKESFYSLYIASDGALCLNIDAATSAKVKELVKVYKESNGSIAEEIQHVKLMEAYEAVLMQVHLCMSDTFSRLKVTTRYRVWYQHHQSTVVSLQELGWKVESQ